MKQNDTEGKPEKSYTMLVTNITFITSYNKTRISSIPNNPQSWNIINHFCGFLWDSYGIPMGFLWISMGFYRFLQVFCWSKPINIPSTSAATSRPLGNTSANRHRPPGPRPRQWCWRQRNDFGYSTSGQNTSTGTQKINGKIEFYNPT